MGFSRVFRDPPKKAPGTKVPGVLGGFFPIWPGSKTRERTLNGGAPTALTFFVCCLTLSPGRFLTCFHCLDSGSGVGQVPKQKKRGVCCSRTAHGFCERFLLHNFMLVQVLWQPSGFPHFIIVSNEHCQPRKGAVIGSSIAALFSVQGPSFPLPLERAGTLASQPGPYFFEEIGKEHQGALPLDPPRGKEFLSPTPLSLDCCRSSVGSWIGVPGLRPQRPTPHGPPTSSGGREK